MKGPFFRRLFILYAVILLLSVLITEFYITRIVREDYIRNLVKDLTVQARLISDIIPLRTETIDIFTKEIKEKTGSRITVVAQDGSVLGDSEKDPSLMDNHKNRPEIQQAILSDIGWSIRYSDTLKYDLLYTAIKVEDDRDTSEGFVRLAIPLKDVNESINALRLKIITGVVVVLLASGLLSIFQTVRIRNYVRQITEFTGALARGLLDRRLHIQGAGEFSEIAQDLNTMSTELKHSIDQQKEEATRLNMILKSIPDPLLIINKDGIIEQYNDASRELTGKISPAGKHFFEVVRNPDFFSLIDQVKGTLAPGIADLRIDVPEERYMTVRVSPLFYKKHELSGYIVILHDTTRLKKLEEIRKDFVANVSHEIKTPVTAIKGFAETLLEGALDDREHAVKFLNTIKSHSERLNRLVEDLLTISRIELGVIRLDKREINISDIISTVTEMLHSRAEAKNLYLRKELKAEDVKIMLDKDRTIQILINLIDNAIKFTEKGGVEIGIDKEGERNYIFVKDTGIGVPFKYLPRMGERFFRVDPSRSRELGGTGLGLAIVKHLVKAHGWEMKIESEEGKGAVVKIFVT